MSNSDWEVNKFRDFFMSDIQEDSKLKIVLLNFPKGIETYVINLKRSKQKTEYVKYLCKVKKDFFIGDIHIEKDQMIKLSFPLNTLKKAWKNSGTNIDVTTKNKDIIVDLYKKNKKFYVLTGIEEYELVQ